MQKINKKGVKALREYIHTHTHVYLANRKGITLVALIITIIVMVILAGVIIISAVSDGGVISRVEQAKQEQYKSSEQERVNLVESAAKTAGLGKITEENLENELKTEFGENGYILEENGTDFIVTIKESGRKYIIGGVPKQDDGILERIYSVVDGQWSEGYVTSEDDIPENTTITAKLYKTDSTFAPNTPLHWNGDYEIKLKERNAYKLVIDGTGDVPAVIDMENGTFAAWGYDVFEALESDIEDIENFENYIWYLNEVEINGVNNVPVGAFMYCISIANVDLDSSVKTIGSGAFTECNKLKTINLENITDIESYAFSATRNLKKITLPKAITTIKESTFDFSGLESIDLTNVTTIEEYAFHECKELKSVILSDEITVIEEGVFDYCGALESIDLKNITEIKTYAFRECESLKSIDLSNVNKIGDSAFYYCEDLADVKLSNDIMILESNVFRATSLKDIDLKNVVEIKSMALAQCIYLENIDLKNVNKLGGSIFDACSNLKTITVRSTTLEVSDSYWAFGYLVPDGLVVYVPNEEIRRLVKGQYDENKITVEIKSLEEMENL